jgi:hypothetical protein
VPRYRGVGRYVIGNDARASSLPVTDALAADITKLSRDRVRVDAVSGTLEVRQDDMQEGLVGTLRMKLRDGQTVTGDFLRPK